LRGKNPFLGETLCTFLTLNYEIRDTKAENKENLFSNLALGSLLPIQKCMNVLELVRDASNLTIITHFVNVTSRIVLYSSKHWKMHSNNCEHCIKMTKKHSRNQFKNLTFANKSYGLNKKYKCVQTCIPCWWPLGGRYKTPSSGCYRAGQG
jgi:hypothetical protein